MVDATVLYAGMGWPRWSHEVLRHAVSEDFRLVLAPVVIKQARKNLLEDLPDRAATFDAWLTLVPFELVSDPSPGDVANNNGLVRQVEDIPVALAAINAKVDYFISDDKDFTAEDTTTAELRQRLKVMRPVIFLREVMGRSSEDLEKVRHRDWPVEEK
jgi:hypothetical protein